MTLEERIADIIDKAFNEHESDAMVTIVASEAIVGLLRQEDIPKKRIQRAMEELAEVRGSQRSINE